MTDVHVLESGSWRLGVLPDAGGSWAFGQIREGGDWVDVLRPTEESVRHNPDWCASFVLVPWSNRVRDGVLAYQGEEFRLRHNANDGTAIHGAARDFPWRVEESTPTRLALAFDSRDFVGVAYPWPFTARHVMELDEDRLVSTLSIRNEHTGTIPVGLGHHPYFVRSLTSPGDEAQVVIPCELEFPLTGAMVDGPAHPVSAEVDFRHVRSLGTRFIDHCLTGRIGSEPIRIIYPMSGRSIEITADDVFENVVVYVPQQGKPFFAIEPVTNANDGFNLLRRGVEHHGIHELEPGEELTGTVTLRVR